MTISEYLTPERIAQVLAHRLEVRNNTTATVQLVKKEEEKGA